jgi:hypothetical protein
MAALITEQDLNYMKSFPVSQKARLMQLIMTRIPLAEENYQGNTDCVKSIRKLRADGLRLIDLQQLEGVFRSIWYRRDGSMLESLMGRARSEVAAMVVWELNGGEDDVAAVSYWQI